MRIDYYRFVYLNVRCLNVGIVLRLLGGYDFFGRGELLGVVFDNFKDFEIFILF